MEPKTTRPALLLALFTLFALGCGSSIDKKIPPTSPVQIDSDEGEEDGERDDDLDPVGVQVDPDEPAGCPTPRITAAAGNGAQWTDGPLTVENSTTIRLSALESTGDIGEFEWTLYAPTASRAAVMPNEFDAEPTFFADVVGDYRIELRALPADDGLDCSAVATTRVTARAGGTTIGDHDVRIELTWTHPDTPGVSDGAGSDLDLHVLHPNGSQWNLAPWDIHWNNTTADWGPPGPSGDPTLTTDDDGFGPETFALSGPESVSYAIGIYYYASYDLGRSLATLRIFVDGELTREFVDKEMKEAQEFWYAGAVTFPSGSMSTVDTMSPGFPN